MLVITITTCVFNHFSPNSYADYMKLHSKDGLHWDLDFAMGKTKGIIFWFCISCLAGSWRDGALGAPASDFPLLKKYYTLDSDHQQTSSVSSGSNCNSYMKSSVSQNPVSYSWTRYENPSTTSLTSSHDSADQRQQLLYKASSLLNQLDSSGPDKYAIEIQETALLQNLVDRLEAFKKRNVVSANSASTQRAIAEDKYNSIVEQYLEVRLLLVDSLNPRDNQLVQPALDALYKTFMKIITGQLLDEEIPNLCSTTLALNTKLMSIDAPTGVQDAVTDFLKSVTFALTGQSQVSILGLCDCLNDLETSVVTVVENDKSQKLQYLLTNLVDAVTNVVVSGGDVGCNVIDVVQRYVASIKQAVQQDANVRAGQIYSSVLSFEEELYKVLIESQSTADSPNSLSQNTISAYPGTTEDCLTEISQLSKTIFGDRTNNVRSVLETLLSIKKAQNPSPKDQSDDYSDSNETTIENMKKIYDLLKSVDSNPQIDSTHVLEVIVDQLSSMPQTDNSKVLQAFEPVLENNNDATAIVVDATIFTIKEKLVQQTDSNGNVVDIIRSGFYNLVNPETNISWSGSYAVQKGTMETDSDGNMFIKGSGVYDVDLPDTDFTTSSGSRVKRQGNFEIQANVVTQVDSNGNSIVTESGTYSLRDQKAGTSQSGKFVVKTSVSQVNPDGSIELMKSGSVDNDESEATLPGEQKPVENDYRSFLLNEHIFEVPDCDGNVGNGIFNIKNTGTNEQQSGTIVIQILNETTNSDGSVDTFTSGLTYIDADHSTSCNSDPILMLTNGSYFSCNGHRVIVKDKYGHDSTISTGVFTSVDPTEGISKSINYVTQSVIKTSNPDGSLDITKSGTLENLVVIASSTTSSNTPGSSSYPSEPSTISFAKPLQVTDDSLQVLINSLNPVNAVETTRDNPSPTDNEENSYSASTGQNPMYYTTSIVTHGTTFIIDEFTTPLVDTEGTVFGEIKMGTYHFTDPTKNTSWSGAFEVEESSMEEIYPGTSEVVESGRFDVSPPENSPCSTIEGNFSIKKVLTMISDESGIRRVDERGTYSFTDSTTGVSKSGSYVVHNSASKLQPGDTIEVVKSGVLLVGESDSTLSSQNEELVITGCDKYLLFQDHIFNEPDSDENCGTGIYCFKDSETNESTEGTYTLQQVYTINNPDGTVIRKTEGVIHRDDFNPDSTPISVFTSMVKDGVKFTTDDQLTYVTDSYGHVSLVGNGRYSQTDPETGETQSVDYVIWNVASTDDSDGCSNVRKFGGFSIDDEPTISTSTISYPSNTFGTKVDSFKSHIYSDNSMRPTSKSSTPNTEQDGPCGSTNQTPTTVGEPLSGSTNVEDDQTNPIDEAIAILGDGVFFMIDEHVVSQLDTEGNVISLAKTGKYSFTAPQTKVIWSGNFETDNILIESSGQGNTDVTQTGTFDVNLPEGDTSTTKTSENQGTFLIKDHSTVTVDKNGIPQTNEDGKFELTNPATGASKSGYFLVHDSLSTPNPDGSIDVFKHGTLYLSTLRTTFSRQQPLNLPTGTYFLRDEHRLSVPDSDGNYGYGTMKFPQSNEYKSGPYRIHKTSTIKNSDGTVDMMTSGFTYAVSPRFSTPSTSSYPSMDIIDETQFTRVDHLSYGTDAFGRITGQSIGNITETDLKTGCTVTRNYVVWDMNTVINPDGSQDVTSAGVLYDSTNSDDSTNPSPTLSNPSDRSPESSTPDSDSAATLSELKGSLTALLNSLDALKTQTSQTTRDEIVSGTSSGRTSTTVFKTRTTSDYVVLPRLNVIAAINGQCLSIGDVVVVQTNSGATLVATIQDSSTPVTFYVTSSPDLGRKCATTNRVFTISENDFSKADRSLIDAVLKSANPPCYT